MKRAFLKLCFSQLKLIFDQQTDIVILFFYEQFPIFVYSIVVLFSRFFFSILITAILDLLLLIQQIQREIHLVIAQLLHKVYDNY